jgi:hypothetical protein
MKLHNVVYLLIGALLWLSTVGALDAHGNSWAKYEGKPVSYWIERLENGAAKERMLASHALARIGMDARNAAPALTKALRDSNEHVRRNAANALSHFGAASRIAVTNLTAALGAKTDADLRQYAARALGSIGPDAASAVPSLAGALDDPDRFVRAKAATALERIGTTNALYIVPLRKLLDDSDLHVFRAASKALSNLDPKSAPLIEEKLLERNPGKWGLRNTLLPTKVAATEGELSLYADYDGTGPGTIALYLVNKTDEDAVLPSQDGALFIKLERLRPDGIWERAETHRYSGCGNSYFPTTLKSSRFFRFQGLYPSNGAPHRVRYRSYGGVKMVSNAGAGLVPKEQIEEARYDQMAINHVPNTLKGAFADKHTLPSLGQTPPRRRVAALELLRSYGQGHFYRRESEKWARKMLAESRTAEELKAAKRIMVVLADKWPNVRDRSNLAQRCGGALTDRGKKLSSGSPESDRVLTWCLMQELIYGKTPDGYAGPGNNYAYDSWNELDCQVSDLLRSQIVAECRRVVADGPDEEKGFAASVLVSQEIGGDLVESLEVERLTLDKHLSVWRWAAAALVKSGKREKLAELASQRPREDDLHIIWMLRHKMPEKIGKTEERFWDECAKHNPGGIAYVLRGVYTSARRPVPLRFRKPVLAFIEEEIKNPSVFKNSQAEYDLVAALQVMASWNDASDTALLLGYLEHPCASQSYRSRNDSKHDLVKTYPVRTRVKTLLQKRGVDIPSSAVFEENLGIAPLAGTKYGSDAAGQN